jgi:hypothetical protein
MRDASDRYQVSDIPLSSYQKRLGAYLLEAGLVSPDQINVALNDQQATGMKFGEVLVARGWLKEVTVEWIMEKVILPERQVIEAQISERSHPPMATMPQTSRVATASRPAAPPPPPPPHRPPLRTTAAAQSPQPGKSTFVRRDAPIAKSLPPVNSSDSDVSWVG